MTFAALKPGLLLGDGPSFCGSVSVADIGLAVDRMATAHLVEPSDVVAWVPDRRVDDHKWRHAVWCVAGSPGMSGAAFLCASAALRGGAGYVRLSTPGDPDPRAPIESVVHALDQDGWAATVLESADRFGTSPSGRAWAAPSAPVPRCAELVADLGVPVVIDGDGLAALGSDPPRCWPAGVLLLC